MVDTEPTDDRALESRVRRAEAILRQGRRDLAELTADVAVLVLSLHDVLDRIARLDRTLQRVEVNE